MRERENKSEWAEFHQAEKPTPLVESAIEYLSPGSIVLDLGSGGGRDAIFLAQKGFEVIAVDQDESGCDVIRERAQKAGAKVDVKRAEALKYLESCEPVDSIVSVNLLPVLANDQVPRFLDLLQNKTLPGGSNVLAAFIEVDEARRKYINEHGRHAFQPGELAKYYQDKWEVLFYDEDKIITENHGSGPHQHHLVELIARKLE